MSHCLEEETARLLKACTKRSATQYPSVMLALSGLARCRITLQKCGSVIRDGVGISLLVGLLGPVGLKKPVRIVGVVQFCYNRVKG